MFEDINIDTGEFFHQFRLSLIHKSLGNPVKNEERSGISFSFLISIFKSTFLPNNLSSLRPEYLEYQFWDCLQGLSSYLRGVLATSSVLTAAGVFI